MARKDLSIAILTPSFRAPSWYYTQSMLALMLHLAHKGLRGEPVSVAQYVEIQCSCLPAGRQKLLDMCLNLNLANKLTHAVFIDDDMQFPSNILDDIMVEGKCVGVNYLRKEGTERKAYTAIAMDGTMLDSSKHSGLEEVESLGLGLFCMDLKQVQKTEAPHFEMKYNESAGAYIGEDVNFMRKLKAAHVKIYCSHEASQKVGHVGEYIYKI